MISEGDPFFINNDPDGNLTAAGSGWTYPEQHPHPGGSGHERICPCSPSQPS